MVFKGCSSLTSVIIPNSIAWIRYGLFQNCTSLTSVTIPSSVTRIDGSVFQGCSSLTSVIIPNSVNRIEGLAFYHCSSLSSATIEATTPPTLSGDIFPGTSENLVIYVPAESVETYKSANIWSTYASRIQAIPST